MLEVLQIWQASTAIVQQRRLQTLIAALHCSYPQLLPEWLRSMRTEAIQKEAEELKMGAASVGPVGAASSDSAHAFLLVATHYTRTRPPTSRGSDANDSDRDLVGRDSRALLLRDACTDDIGVPLP